MNEEANFQHFFFTFGIIFSGEKYYIVGGAIVSMSEDRYCMNIVILGYYNSR